MQKDNKTGKIDTPPPSTTAQPTPTMARPRKTKLSSEVAKNKKRPNVFFGILLVFLASTSYAFGQLYLAKFYWELLGWLKIGQGTKEFLFPLLGGLSALLLTTGAYLWWKSIKLFSAETEEQFSIAQLGERVSFGVDLLFTITALITLVGGDLIEPEVKTTLEWIAIGLFVFLSAFHAVLRDRYQDNSIETREQRTRTITDGKRVSERLDYQASVSRQALLIASSKAEQDAPAYAEQLSEFWRYEILDGLPTPPQQIAPTVAQQTGSADTNNNGIPDRLERDYKPVSLPSTDQVIRLNGSPNGYYPKG